jgi:hypothetical protein
MSKVTWNIRDFSDEYSGFTLNIPDVDETSWVATNTSVLALQTAVDAICIGNIATRNLQAYSENVDDTRPTSPYAQRETGLRFFYSDNVNGNKYHATLPCPDLSIVAEAGTDQVDLEEVLVAAVVTAFEALAVSPDGNAITINKAVIVGRRS